MNHDKKYTKEMKQEVVPTESDAKLILEKDIKLLYRHAIGELLFVAFTYRPDIIYYIIKLYQYNTKPTRTYYVAVKRVFKYLRDTINDGLYHWRTDLNPSLPTLPTPNITKENHNVSVPLTKPKSAICYVDSD